MWLTLLEIVLLIQTKRLSLCKVSNSANHKNKKMKSNHTKGEWKVNRNNDGDINTVYSEYHGAICSFPRFYGVKPTEDGTTELEANARLVAAAPDLLKALKLFVSSEQWRKHIKTSIGEFDTAFEAAQLAIQKATHQKELA